ncbi:hypothetical protein CXB51_009063 [Gossypium anomalum]|uniref:DUF7745 domain-containing protein n=2 Tax=Gossypium TaxID=3633 RepID=A0A8J5YYQ5_9ROSI|nr:hypothetical protein CXB51_009063 [Gossypium anomalum]
MEESITQVTEKNVVVRDWSLKTQKVKRGSLTEGCISNLPEQVATNWDSDTRGIFTEKYGDIAHLIAVNVDEQLIQAMVRFWDPMYQCFTFNHEDMTPTIKEYAALLHIDNVQFNKIYVKESKPMTFKKKLVWLTGMTDIWAGKQIKKKNEFNCILWFSLRDLVQNHLDIAKRIDLFALAIYELIIFPKVLGHIEVAIVDLFERLNHFWKVERTPFHIFSKTFAPLKAYLEKDWPKDVTEQHWVSVFQNLRAEEITWRAQWICPLVMIFKCESQDWFIPATGGLAQSEFAFTGEGYMKRVRDTAKSWKEIHLMELALYADTITQDYDL